MHPPTFPNCPVPGTPKAYDTPQVADLRSGRSGLLSPSTRMVLFLNGFSGAQIFAGRFPPEQMYCARVVTGFPVQQSLPGNGACSAHCRRASSYGGELSSYTLVQQSDEG